MQEIADFLSRFGAFFWLGLALPALLINTIVFGEGHRLILAARRDGLPERGPRLLRLIGGALMVVLVLFVGVGVLAVVNFVEVPFQSVPMSLSFNLRRIVGTMAFFVTSPILGFIGYRLLNFISPRRFL